MAENEAAAGQQAGNPQFKVQKTYLKDVSFETPMGVKIFTLDSFQPSVGLEVNTNAKAVGENLQEVVLTITCTARVGEETAYLVELQQAGVFQIEGFGADQGKLVLATVCPNFLFPYAREAIDNIVVKGGFPALNLAPIDFDNIYRQSLEQQAGDQAVN